MPKCRWRAIRHRLMINASAVSSSRWFRCGWIESAQKLYCFEPRSVRNQQQLLCKPLVRRRLSSTNSKRLRFRAHNIYLKRLVLDCHSRGSAKSFETLKPLRPTFWPRKVEVLQWDYLESRHLRPPNRKQTKKTKVRLTWILLLTPCCLL